MSFLCVEQKFYQTKLQRCFEKDVALIAKINQLSRIKTKLLKTAITIGKKSYRLVVVTDATLRSTIDFSSAMPLELFASCFSSVFISV